MPKKTSFPKQKIKLLMLEGIHPSALRLFKEQGYTEIEVSKSAWSEKELLQKVSDVHLLGIRSKTQITGSVLLAAHKLIAIGAFCVGTNQIEMSSAIENGVAVFNSPFSNTRSVAEL